MLHISAIVATVCFVIVIIQEVKFYRRINQKTLHAKNESNNNSIGRTALSLAYPYLLPRLTLYGGKSESDSKGDPYSSIYDPVTDTWLKHGILHLPGDFGRGVAFPFRDKFIGKYDLATDAFEIDETAPQKILSLQKQYFSCGNDFERVRILREITRIIDMK